MSRKWLKATLIALIAATMCAGICACAAQTEAPYDYTVTFSYNLFTWDEESKTWQDTRTPEHLGVLASDPYLLQPGADSKWPVEAFEREYVGSWHLPETDEAGEPLRNEDGTVKLGRAWDFKEDRVEGDTTLYAAYLNKPRILVMDGENVVKEYLGMPGTTRRRPDEIDDPSVENKTFYDYYADPDFTEKYEWNYTFEAGKDEIVYAKFLNGIWKIVDTPSEFNSALAGSNKVYVDADITFTAETPYVPNKMYRGELDGQGHTLFGIDVVVEGNQNTRNIGVLFNELSASSYVHDITFSGVRATFKTGIAASLYRVSLVAHKAYAGARIENVTVTGEIVQGNIGPAGHIAYFQDICENEATETSFDVTSTVPPDIG